MKTLADPFVMETDGGWVIRDGLLLLSHWPNGSECEGVAAIRVSEIVGYRLVWGPPTLLHVLTTNGGTWTLDFTRANEELRDGGATVVGCYEEIERAIAARRQP